MRWSDYQDKIQQASSAQETNELNKDLERSFQFLNDCGWTDLKIDTIIESNVCSDDLYENLDFLSGGKTGNINDSILSIYNDSFKANTSRILFGYLAVNPLSDINRITERQDCIRRMRGSIGNRIRKIMDWYGKNENEVMDIWKYYSDDRYRGYIFEKFPSITKNAMLMRANHHYKVWLGPIMSLLSPIFIGIGVYLGMRHILKIEIPWSMVWRLVKEYFMGYVGSFKQTISDLRSGSVYMILSKLLSILSYGFTIYATVMMSLELHRYTSKLCAAIRSMNTLYNKFAELWQIVKSDRLLRNVAGCFISEKDIIEINEYHTMIKEYYIGNELRVDLVFIQYGSIFSCYERMRIQMKKMSRVFSLFMWCDVLLKMADYSRKKQMYPVVFYNNNNHKGIYIKCPEMMPLFRKKDHKRFGNTVNINTGYILLGPNNSGKSTYMRTILTHILFAQTFGYSLSRGFIMKTPYKRVLTYMNVVDKHGESSTFQHQVAVCEGIIDMLKTNVEPTFLVMDEILNGTNPIFARQLIETMLRYISGQSLCNFLLCTHHLIDSCEQYESLIFRKYKLYKSFNGGVTPGSPFATLFSKE